MQTRFPNYNQVFGKYEVCLFWGLKSYLTTISGTKATSIKLWDYYWIVRCEEIRNEGGGGMWPKSGYCSSICITWRNFWKPQMGQQHWRYVCFRCQISNQYPSNILRNRDAKYRVIQKDGLNFVRLYFLNYIRYVNDLHNIWKRRS